MDALLEKIIRNLETQQALYQRFLGALEKENDAVIASDRQGVDTVVREKEDILYRIESLERERNKMLRDISGILGAAPEEITLSRLSREAGDRVGSRLNKLKDDLSGLMHRIREKNEVNKQLLNHCLGVVRGSLSLINGMVSPSTVYYKSGKMTDGAKGGLVLSGSI